MNLRIHQFKVYRIETTSGMKFWTFRTPKTEDIKDYGDKVLEECSLWDLLNIVVKNGDKAPNEKSLVNKNDLEFLLQELAVNGGFEKIVRENE